MSSLDWWRFYVCHGSYSLKIGDRILILQSSLVPKGETNPGTPKFFPKAKPVQMYISFSLMYLLHLGEIQ